MAYVDEARRLYWHSLRGSPTYRAEFARQSWVALFRAAEAEDRIAEYVENLFGRSDERSLRSDA